LKESIRNGLSMQGFDCGRQSLDGKLQLWLRFTTGLSALWVILGTIAASPPALWVFSAIALIGAAGKYHPFDYLFNYGLRHLVGAPALPENPVPRRFAMVVAAACSALVGALFAQGWAVAGYVGGALVASAGILVTTTHYCIGSKIYHLLSAVKRNLSHA
jgi:hypothetical protein